MFTVFLLCFSSSASAWTLGNQHPTSGPIPQNVADDDVLIRFAPRIFKSPGACIPHVRLDLEGITTRWDTALQSCEELPYKGQILGKKIQYQDKWALIYTAFYPVKGQFVVPYDTVTVHDGGALWVTSVVWLKSLTDTEFEHVKAIEPVTLFHGNAPGTSQISRSQLKSSSGLSGASPHVPLSDLSSGQSIFQNPLKIPAGVSVPANTFKTELSNVGYYWIPGTTTELTQNEVVDFDLLDAATRSSLGWYDFDNVLATICPLVDQTVYYADIDDDDENKQGSTGSSTPQPEDLSAEENLNCSYQRILQNQYHYLYRGVQLATHCI